MESKVFKAFDLPEVPVLRQTPCDMDVSGVRKQGHLYITEEHVLFFSKIAGKTVKVQIPFSDIQKLNKLNTALVVPNAIEFVTSASKHFFSSISQRDEIYDTLLQIWRKGESPASDSPESLSSSDSQPKTESDSSLSDPPGAIVPAGSVADDSAATPPRVALPMSESKEIASSLPSLERAPQGVPDMPPSSDGEEDEVKEVGEVKEREEVREVKMEEVEEKGGVRQRLGKEEKEVKMEEVKEEQKEEAQGEKQEEVREEVMVEKEEEKKEEVKVETAEMSEKKEMKEDAVKKAAEVKKEPPSTTKGYPLWVNFGVPVALLGVVVVARYLTH